MEKNQYRYRPPKHPQHDLALIKVAKRIIFSSNIMPICLPPSAKFPDKKGIVHVAGWGLNHESTKEGDCTTGGKGPDPFSKCKFPFFKEDPISKPVYKCFKQRSPSYGNRGCLELYKMMKRRGASFLDQNYGRVNNIYLNQ